MIRGPCGIHFVKKYLKLFQNRHVFGKFSGATADSYVPQYLTIFLNLKLLHFFEILDAN